MKKIFLFLLIFYTVSSCKFIDKNEESNENLNSTAAKDSSIVNDKDENGCLASAGYIWSRLNKECIKGFSGIQLNPIDNQKNEDETLSAYVLFNENATKAEIFLPKEASSIILTKSSQGNLWTLNDWQLMAQNGYMLKKGNATLFSGDGEIGKKVLGSDTEEQ